MNFLHYYTDVIKKSYDFKTRTRRRDFWMFTLINTVIYILLFLGAGMISVEVASLTVSIYSLLMLVSQLALVFRRLHDTNRSAWWLLIVIIPFIGPIIFLVFTLLDSTPGSNKYGPNPKAEVAPVPNQ